MSLLWPTAETRKGRSRSIIQERLDRTKSLKDRLVSSSFRGSVTGTLSGGRNATKNSLPKASGEVVRKKIWVLQLFLSVRFWGSDRTGMVRALSARQHCICFAILLLPLVTWAAYSPTSYVARKATFFEHEFSFASFAILTAILTVSERASQHPICAKCL